MNVDQLVALATDNIKTSSGSLKDFQETHLALFRKNPFQEKVADSYKFLNLKSAFEAVSFSKTEEKIPEVSGPSITLMDGMLKDTHALPKGVEVKDLTPELPTLLKNLSETHSLSSLHHALMKGGAYIEVSGEVDHPIHIIHEMSGEKLAVPTVYIRTQKLSKVTLIEEFPGGAEFALLGETYIEAGAGSKIEHICVNRESGKGFNHHSLSSSIPKDATVRSLIITESGTQNRNNLELNINEPGAHGESFCLFLTNGTEQSDIYTMINHRAEDTTSAQIAKGILGDDSKGVFTGKIHIFPKAQRVSSSQLNKNLLLSKKAQVHSQPQLEIFADDVKCSHGSTTGQLSPDEIFYFKARGIPEDMARNLLAMGFGLEIVQKIENKKAREYLHHLVKASLENKFSLKGDL